MKIIDACGQAATPELLRSALKEVAPSVELTARMHPSQCAMIESFGIAVSTTDIALGRKWEEAGFPITRTVRTCAGRPIIEDAWMPEDRIRFEHEGVPVIGIVNVAVPVFQEL
jgi:hypothetical protein